MFCSQEKNYSQINQNSFVYYPITYLLRYERKYINKRHYSASNFSQGRKTQSKRKTCLTRAHVRYLLTVPSQ